MFQLISTHMTKYRKYIVANIFVLFLQVVIQAVFLMKEMKNIIDYGVSASNMDYIVHSGIRMVLFSIAVGLCTVFASKLSAIITAGVTTDVRASCYKKVASLSPKDYNHFGTSTLLTRTLTDGTQVQTFMINFMRSAMTVPFIIVIMLILIFRINLVLFGILAGAFALTVGMLVFFGAKSISGFEKLQSKIDNINLLMKEKIIGVRAIRAFRNEELEEAKLERANKEAYETAIRANRITNFLSPLSLIIMNWTIVLIYLAGSHQLQAKMASISDLILIFQYLSYFVTCLAIVPFLVNLLPKFAVSCSRINELLNYEPEVNDNVGASKAQIRGGEIEFRNVIFGYAKATKAIANVSFVAKRGETTAFIGSTGSGKTTIMNLVMGFYEPTFGEVFVDGQSLGEIDREDYRKHIALASQRALVFQDTVYNNLAMYDTSVSIKRMEQACKAAKFDEVLENLPDDLNTMMAQDGKNLSGGQRQRLSLARAVTRDADIYIFDDSFSALDAKTEKYTLTEIGNMLKKKTILIVAQKISTIRHADRIIVLDQGRVVGIGSHAELLDNCREYQEMYRTQSYLDKEDE